MRKNCETCKHDDAEFSCYPHKTPCNECLHGKGCNDAPTQWEAAEHYKPDTNADRIRAMSDEEKAREFVFFCPSDSVFRGEDTYGKPHYTGLDGKYYSTSEEVISANSKWLKQPAED